MENPMRPYCLIVLSALFFIGCAGEETDTPAPAAPSAQRAAVEPTEPSAPEKPAPAEQPMALPSISLGSGGGTSAEAAAPKTVKKTSAESRRDLLAAMKPVQVMLGGWNGTTQKVVGDFKALDKPQWVWDFQTNRDQPAMVMTSEKSPYFREARLTYLTDKELFQLTSTDPEGKTRTYQGKFSEPVEEFEGDDQKMHVRYALNLEQIDAETARDQWQITFNQQHNHRYLVELAKKRGSRFLKFDTVATQREGTSFAKNDSDYGDRECIISGGLGTMQVSYNGKSYWVCCTGCQAAFNDDPESWLAEFAKKKAAEEVN